MKKFFSLFAAVLFAGSMFAGTEKVTCTMPNSGSLSNNKITIEDVEWTVSATNKVGTPSIALGDVTYDKIKKSAMKFGSSKTNYYPNISFTTDYFADKAVSSVTVTYAINGGVSTTLKATQGEVEIGSDTYSTAQKWYTAVMNTESGVSGTLTISITTTQSVSIHAIEIEYTETSAPTKVANPKFSLAEGTYEGKQNVSLTCKTEGAAIYYTLDGTDPTASSKAYSAAIEVSESLTIKAVAVKDGLENSEIVSATYTILAGADVVLDFSDNSEWAIPGPGANNAKTTGLHEYTSGDYTIKLYGPTGNGYYYDGDNIMLGKTDAYLAFPVFADKAISRIVVVGYEAGSGAVSFNIYKGEDEVSTEVTSCKVDQTFDISPKEKNVEYLLKITNNNNIRFQKIKIWFGEADPMTAIENTAVEAKAIKTFENGQLVIIKNGVKYNATGAVIR